MVQISKYLLDLDLRELLDILEIDDDIDNVLIILQMLELNDLAALERLKLQSDKEQAEEEDDLLAGDDKEEQEKKEQQKKALEEAKKKHEKTHDVIESILAQPAKFWETNDISSFANSLLGTIIIPDKKPERSAMAGGILFGIVKSKTKNFDYQYDGNRKNLFINLKAFKKEQSCGKDIIS